MKVTEVPAQTAPEGLAATETLTGSSGLTVIVMALEVAGDPETQFALLVIIQVMASPSASDDEL